ncbi:MAG: DNA-directed RNA polymerase subunit beta [Erysipelothrix sp.]|nr:DNA-directed RNA polymerase subunit beta [Erysipelothrix sp.]
MTEKLPYRIDREGTKSERRNYSKISGTLELPDLVEIQTDAFEWLKKEGLKEVFDEIYPIENHNQSVKLRFLDYKFDEPKYDVAESKRRETTYSAPLRARMELNITDRQTGELIQKIEDVFMGDFPLMSDTGTFIINGAERVIVSQIVRSPGAYFDIDVDNKTGKDVFAAELIPSRGTWLELVSDSKKQAVGTIINMKVDRKRSLLSTVLFKAFGLSLNPENSDTPLDSESFEKFLSAIGYSINKDLKTPEEGRDYLNHYILLYNSIFGEYEAVTNTLVQDKISTTEEALRSIYENQRSDEIPTIDGAINLMNAKFLDYRRYDLNKAGRYKLNKKLGVSSRAFRNVVNHDILGAQGEVIIKKGTIIGREERNAMRSALESGTHLGVYPLNHLFSHPDKKLVPLTWTDTLVGRITAQDIDDDNYTLDIGTVLTEKDLVDLKANGYDNILVYAGIKAKPIVLTKDNARSMFNYGTRLFSLGRLTNSQNVDATDNDNDLLIERYLPDFPLDKMTNKREDAIVSLAKKEELTLWLVGSAVQEISVSVPQSDHEIKVLGPDPYISKKTVTLSDMYAFYSYYLNLMDDIGEQDDIDMLGNRRVRTVGELIQNQVRIGLSRMERVVIDRMSISDVSSLTPKSLTNIRPLTAAVKEFFSSSQLSQFMDQINPLAELTNKRRISALGPGGLSRERASYEVRDVHNSHYGRICPIETPEGPNIGLISNLTTYGRINEYGFIQTPYRIVEAGKVTEDVVYLSADDELDYVIAPANEVVAGEIVNEQVVVRFEGDNVVMDRDEVELADVSPMQIVSVATACIPFLENDDASRALMGANMQRQSVPLVRPTSPLVGTGIEHKLAKDSGTAIVSTTDGIVTYLDGLKIEVTSDDDKVVTYTLDKFRRSNAGTNISQTPIVDYGQRVSKGEIIADGPSMDNGELALGQNVTVAFMSWDGYNYEDAIIMSERMVYDDVYTSIHIEEYEIEVRDTKLGPEEITRDIPNVSEVACRHLDANGIVMVGAEVKEGDVLVGKVTPKGHTELPPEEKLLFAIFGEKTQEVRDNSLKVPHGGSGIVQSVRVFKRSEGYELPPGVQEKVKVYIVQKRKISEGDKMAGRHGNKGVISRILPLEDMPYMPDGTPVDIMLNPMGVPSRMNIGQILEIHLGMAAKKLGVNFATPVFDGIENDELAEIMAEAQVSADGKIDLIDGRTGDKFDDRISVGVMYFIKLAHMVDDKLHARATGPYSLVTQQPLGGKAQNGGQRFGEMEVWALYAYGAAHTLQEIMTIKSDDVVGRTKTYAAIQNGNDIPHPGMPESFRVLKHELQGLALDITFLDDGGNSVDVSKLDEDLFVPQEALVLKEDVESTEESANVDDSQPAEAVVVGADVYEE